MNVKIVTTTRREVKAVGRNWEISGPDSVNCVWLYYVPRDTTEAFGAAACGSLMVATHHVAELRDFLNASWPVEASGEATTVEREL